MAPYGARLTITLTSLALALPLLPGRATADGKLMIYPAAGQTEQQLADDRYACHVEAVAQSGFDPSRPPSVPTGPVSVPVGENPREGAAAKGAVAGAIAGAVLGHETRDAIRGAIAGAVIGGAVEAQGEAQTRGEAEAEARRLAEARVQGRADLDRRRAEYRASIQACLEQRGYSVR